MGLVSGFNALTRYQVTWIVQAKWNKIASDDRGGSPWCKVAPLSRSLFVWHVQGVGMWTAVLCAVRHCALKIWRQYWGLHVLSLTRMNTAKTMDVWISCCRFNTINFQRQAIIIVCTWFRPHDEHFVPVNILCALRLQATEQLCVPAETLFSPWERLST